MSEAPTSDEIVDQVKKDAKEDAEDGKKEIPTPEEMPLPSDPKTIFLGGLFVIAVFAVLSVAQEVVLPIVIALVLKLLLQPIVRLLERIRIPKALGALVAVLLLLGCSRRWVRSCRGRPARW